MIKRFFTSLTILTISLTLAACGSEGDDPFKIDQPFTLSGIAANGPLEQATVEVLSANGTRLGSTQTDALGNFSLKLNYAPPYRVSTSGGKHNGQIYNGSLKAWCDQRAADRQVQCDLTPLSSVTTELIDRGYNNDEAKALLEQRYGQIGNPFTRELRTGETVPPDEFDLTAARSAIDKGLNLDTWVSNTADWVENPLNNPAPPGTPKYSVTLSTSAGGSGTPNPAIVLMNEQAVFDLMPETGYHLDSVTGCNGKLSGSTYTTAAINHITNRNGDCSVTAQFQLNQYTLNYNAGTGGTLSGATPQTVSHNNDGTSITAAPSPAIASPSGVMA